jgi:hypothetical protein
MLFTCGALKVLYNPIWKLSTRLALNTFDAIEAADFTLRVEAVENRRF